jgi:rare lipoprotein A
VRVGPFATESEAERLRAFLAAGDPSAVEATRVSGEAGFGVRLGPYDDVTAAAVMSRIAAAGFEPDASQQGRTD